jgi:hypothetical protein
MSAAADPRPLAPRADVAARDEADDDTESAALARLTLTRERLRQAMTPPPREAARDDRQGLDGIASGLVDRLKSLPGVDLLMGVLESWWARHPLRTVGVVAAEASRKFAAPIAAREPYLLVFGAMAAGALLVLLKPWRLVRRALFAGLLPALLFRLVRELPIESWMKLYGSISVPRGAPVAPAATTTARPSPPIDVPSTAAARPSTSAAAVETQPSTLYP